MLDFTLRASMGCSPSKAPLDAGPPSSECGVSTSSKPIANLTDVNHVNVDLKPGAASQPEHAQQLDNKVSDVVQLVTSHLREERRQGASGG